MINNAVFRYPDGREVTVDRDLTRYSVDGDRLGMTWQGCYFWDGETATYLTEKDYEELANAELVSLYLEDDADADYEVKITSWCV